MSERLIVNLMKHTRLLSQAGASCTDAALFTRFIADRDQSAFTALVHRHGPMVWAVCRNALPSEADAEDAFQATFLALVRSAHRIQRGAAVGAWLHSTAVRVCHHQRRSKRRRVDREARVARSEAAGSESIIWSDEMARAHEAIRALPRREHEVFVLCVLEGIAQADAARRLSLKLNTVSGLLARASKRLRTQLTSSGTLSLGALAVAASCPAAVPAHLINLTVRLAGPSAAFPSSLLILSTSVLESAMRKAIIITLVTLTLGVGVTAGRWFLAASEAQEAKQSGQFGGFSTQNPVQTVQGYSLPLNTWEYKVFTSENHHGIESKLNSLGKEGWELNSATTVPNSNHIMYVFKRSRTAGQQAQVYGQWLNTYGQAAAGNNLATRDRYYEQATKVADTGVTLKKEMNSVSMIPLKHTSSTDMAQIVKELFKNQKVAADSRTNSLLLQGNAEEISKIKELIEKLDDLKNKSDKP